MRVIVHEGQAAAPVLALRNGRRDARGKWFVNCPAARSPTIGLRRWSCLRSGGRRRGRAGGTRSRGRQGLEIAPLDHQTHWKIAVLQVQSLVGAFVVWKPIFA